MKFYNKAKEMLLALMELSAGLNSRYITGDSELKAAAKAVEAMAALCFSLAKTESEDEGGEDD